MKSKHWKLLTAGLAFVLVAAAMLYREHGKIDSCDPTHWRKADSFDQNIWFSSDRREEFLPILQMELRGDTADEVVKKLGQPNVVKGRNPPIFEYKLGDVKLFSCMMNINAMMHITFDDAGRVSDVTGYVD